MSWVIAKPHCDLCRPYTVQEMVADVNIETDEYTISLWCHGEKEVVKVKGGNEMHRISLLWKQNNASVRAFRTKGAR